VSRAISGSDIVDVDQLLVAALFVPDLVTRVARVREDCSDGALAPRIIRISTMAVSCRVMPAGRENTVSV
jgi:hypothetical protein